VAIGQFDDAVRQLKTVFELDPKFAVAHGTFGEIYTQEGRYQGSNPGVSERTEIGGKL